MNEPDWDYLYPAKDWNEAIKRIVESGWYLTLQVKNESRWVAIIHNDINYSTSWQTVTGIGENADKAVMDAYNKWRDEQLEGDKDE